jgi:3-dehydroquinate dehydratase
MSKKPNRRSPAEENQMTAVAEAREEAVAPIANKPAPTLTSVLLKDVRNAALKASADAHHNIAELESWRNEIDATIAFLRAQQK